MATKVITCPTNVTLFSTTFTKNSNSVYTGNAKFVCDSGFKFTELTVFGTIAPNYKIRVTRTDGTTFDIANNTSWCNWRILEQAPYDGDDLGRLIQFALLKGAGVQDNIFALNWELIIPPLEVVTPTHTEVNVTENLQNCTISGLPQYVYTDTVLNLTLTAANGYKFDVAPTLTPNSGTALNFTLSSDNLTATLTVDLSTISGLTSIEISGTANFIPVGRVLQVVENLQNCTISGLPQTVTVNTPLNLTLTAANGYQFNAVPNLDFGVQVLDENGNPTQTKNFTVDSNLQTAVLSVDLSRCNLNWIDLCETLTINGIAASSAQTVPITRSLTNCTTNAPTTIDETFATVNIICTAANGYQFDTAPTIMFYDGNGDILHGFTFNVSQSKLSANVTFDVSQFDDFADVETIVLTATANAIPQTVTVTVNSQNCTVDGVPQTVYPDTVLNLIATANSGYKFDTETPPQVYILDAQGNPNVINFVLSENDTVAQCTVNLGGYSLNSYSTITITANAAAVTPYLDKYGTINVYKVTTQNLSDFAAQRFFKEKIDASDTSGYFQLVDLGDYVVSVKRFYCLISDVLTAYIKAGNYNTNIEAETPKNDNFVIDCGTVAIPMQNNSITDYQNTEIKVFLPFVGFVSLPSDYVGKTIALQYRVNIVNGDCLAVLSCNGIEIDFVQCTISNDVIFKTNKENSFSGNTEFNLQVLKGLQPYAVIKTVTDENKQLFNSDCVRVSLSTINGYFAANEIENFVSDTITDTEKQTLFNEIANGVFILAV